MNTGTEAVLIASVRLTLPFVCFFSFYLVFLSIYILYVSVSLFPS